MVVVVVVVPVVVVVVVLVVVVVVLYMCTTKADINCIKIIISSGPDHLNRKVE